MFLVDIILKIFGCVKYECIVIYFGEWNKLNGRKRIKKLDSILNGDSIYKSWNFSSSTPKRSLSYDPNIIRFYLYDDRVITRNKYGVSMHKYMVSDWEYDDDVLELLADGMINIKNRTMSI